MCLLPHQERQGLQMDKARHYSYRTRVLEAMLKIGGFQEHKPTNMVKVVEYESQAQFSLGYMEPQRPEGRGPELCCELPKPVPKVIYTQNLNS